MKTTLILLAAAVLGAAIIASPPVALAQNKSQGDKAPASQPTTAASPSKFYGTISAVDAEKKTITIDEKTYSIVPESDMTKAADGSAATFENATVGETARGTFTTSSDGTMKVTKIRFGKKTGGGKKDNGTNDKKKDPPATQATAQ